MADVAMSPPLPACSLITSVNAGTVVPHSIPPMASAYVGGITLSRQQLLERNA